MTQATVPLCPFAAECSPAWRPGMREEGSSEAFLGPCLWLGSGDSKTLMLIKHLSPPRGQGTIP